MYKVVVVEDEEIARKGIIFTINWDALNCMIAGEAANGEEGAETLFLLDLQRFGNIGCKIGQCLSKVKAASGN